MGISTSSLVIPMEWNATWNKDKDKKLGKNNIRGHQSILLLLQYNVFATQEDFQNVDNN